MKNYFIIHGTFGHSKENWFPWLENELKEKGFEVFNFDYPTPEGQSFESWSAVLDKVKDKISNESVFICHSIGCVFLVKYCIKNNFKIKKSIFVSGCNNYFSLEEFDKLNKSMFIDNIGNFIDLCDERICIYSSDDPYISLNALEDFAKSIKAKTLVYKNAGHFNEKAGFKEFPDILKLL